MVEAVVFSPDNKWIASASFDNTIRIWDVETGSELRSLTGHAGAVKALACSPDGNWLVSGGNDKTLRIWDVKSGKEIRNFGSGSGTIDVIAISPDGKTIASGSESKILLRDTSGKEITVIPGSSSPASALAFSPDGTSLASAWDDGKIVISDSAGKKPAVTLKGNTSKIVILKFSPGGELLATAGDDMVVKLWKVSNGRKLGDLGAHDRKILALHFSSPEQLLSADSDRTVNVWSTTGKGSALLGVNSAEDKMTGESRSATFNSDGRYLATGNGDGTVSILDAKKGKYIRTLENHTVGFYDAAFSSDRRWLASASFDNSVKLWDLRTGASLRPLTGHTGRVRKVLFDPDNTRVYSASADHTIRIWDLISERQIEILQGHTNSVSALALGSRGKLLVSGSLDQTVGVWALDSKTPPRFLKGHIGEVISVAISPDERSIASTGADGTIKLWDVATGTVTRNIDVGAGEVDAVAFSSDSKLIAAGGINGAVSVWDAKTGVLLRSITGHTARVNSVAFSPDGKKILSSSQDKTIRMWDVADGRAIFAGDHAGTVFSASFSADGAWLVSASDDGSVRIWNSENGTSLASLVSLKGSDDWLVVTPQGFFDGSPASWAQLSWRFELDTFNVKPVEVFFSEFYVPGLLADLLNGQKLPSNSNISNKDRRQPELKLAADRTSPTARELKVRIDVSHAEGGAKDVRLFRNGALVRSWRGDVLQGKNAVVLEAAIPLIAGENKLTAYAFNTDDVKSRDAALTITGSAALSRKGVSYILAVGVNEYANAEYNLSQADNDARDFADEFSRQQTKLGNFERVDVLMLPDLKGTKANILKALADLAEKVQPEDSLTVFFAGHGIAVKDRFYLVPHDLGYAGRRDKQDAASLQTILDHSISDDELDYAVENIDASHVVLVIDACNSGQVLESAEKRRGPMNSKGLAQLAYEKGMYILTASQSYQAAKEDEKLGHGYLTYALVEEGLKTNAADRLPKDGQVLLREWLDFAAERVPQIDRDEINRVENRARQLEREKGKAAGQGDDGSVQRPRVFYRRESESQPLVIFRP